MMLGWGEMPNNWDLLAYQVSLEEPKEGCLVSSSSACLGSVGPVDQADSYGMETMTLVSTSDTYLVYIKNSCGIPYSTVAASHITITDGQDTKKTYLDRSLKVQPNSIPSRDAVCYHYVFIYIYIYTKI